MAHQSKNVWRAKMLEARSEIGPEKAGQMNRDLCKNLSSVWSEASGLGVSGTPNQQKPLWLGYKSFRWEADPQDAILESSPKIRWAYPRILESSTMEFLEPSTTDAQWTKTSWGIWEPDPNTSTKVSLQDCRGVLVPGVAFDRQGRRLGYGKGFYDRALKDFMGLKVGVAFSLQVSESELPFEDTDVIMDLIVTETDIIRVPKSHPQDS